MKTSELTGAALDWAVARCWYGDEYDMSIPLFDDGLIFAPSTNWSHGGPIIEREGIDICTSTRGGWIATLLVDCEDCEVVRGEGETPLITAMRCYVASKMGDEVEIPEELK